MDRPSLPVESRQTEAHPRLAETVKKHLESPWRRPVSDRARREFDQWAPLVPPGLPLILDTGCGTGMSTAVLAARFPEAFVLGVDKSAHRLDRPTLALPANARTVRFDLEDLWILAGEAGWRWARQCFYYPNPWPKPEQRLRRWAHHPVFPLMASQGGVVELRTNWKVYAEEFAAAWVLTGGAVRELEPWLPAEPETLFEKKYLASGHQLWRWTSEDEARTSGS